MAIEVRVPALPESVADAVIAGWHKKQGDTVRQDENLVDLETDKVILEVPAISNGVITEIMFDVGDTVTADQVLAVIDDSATMAEPDRKPTKNTGEPAHGSPAAGNKPAAKQFDQSISISPSARKLMLENALDTDQVKGSGKGGRILKEDVIKYLDSRANERKTPPPGKPALELPQKEKPATPEAEAGGGRVEKRVPMTRLRARIAERLLEAQHDAAILTTFNEVNMKPIMDLRKKYKEQFEKEFNVKLGFMSFFVKASIEALKKFPAVNASIDGNNVVYHGYFDIGVAVSGPVGLVVPILRNAEHMTLPQIEQTIIDFANKANSSTLSINEITGGTFTISNGGVFGSMLSTPILNPPQSAILGMHAIRERAMVVNGEVVVLPMMYLALSYDHRIIDGREAVQFLATIKDMLEEPSRMLLGI